MSKQLNLIFAFALIAAIGCSKAPKDYNKKAPPNTPVVKEKAVPTDQDFEKALFVEVNGKSVPAKTILEQPISTEDVEGGFSFDAKIKEHSSRPIVYKEGPDKITGAGGLNFNTTLEEAETILVKPRFGPDADGYALYDEGLYVLWRQDKPRTPVFILVLQNYLGEMPMPTPLKPVGMGFDFAKLGYKVNKKEGAEQLAIDYYRILENEGPAYNCITAQTCQVNWGDDSKKDFIFEIPGRLLWLISKDRFVIFRMLLQETKPSIPFDLDILSGNMLVPKENSLGLGQEFSTVESRLQNLLQIEAEDIKTTVGVDSFGRQYGGTAFAYQKTVFDRKAIQPLPTDKMSFIQVWDSYPNLLTFGDRGIIVMETALGVDLRIAKPGEIATLTETVDRREIPLQIRLGLQRQNVRPFVEKLKDLIVTEMKAAYPKAIISARFVGAFQKKTIKDYSAYVVAFDKTANDGLFVQFGADEENGNLTSFTTLKLGGDMNPLDPLIFGDISSPIEKVMAEVPVISSVTKKPLLNADGTPQMKMDKLPVFTGLSGLRIGDTVKVTDWDLGRGEATIQVTDQKGVTHPALRSTYADRSLIQVAFSTEKESPQEVAYVSFGSLNIGVGLKLVDAETTPLLRTYRIVSVTSNVNVTKVLDLCGQQFTPEFGTSSLKFLETLSQIKGCVYLPKKDTGGNGRLVNVYFPDDRIRIGFDQDEMVSATIYAPNSEVQ